MVGADGSPVHGVHGEEAVVSEDQHDDLEQVAGLARPDEQHFGRAVVGCEVQRGGLVSGSVEYVSVGCAVLAGRVVHLCPLIA